jgi:hypothetical protein
MRNRKKFRAYIILLLPLIYIIFEAPLYGKGEAIFIKPSLSDSVKSSSEIAIVDVKNVELLSSNTKPVVSCGYLYHARVIKNIKGNQSSFVFFSSSTSNFIGKRYNYFVLTSSFKPPGTVFSAVVNGSKHFCISRNKIAYKVAPAYLLPIRLKEKQKWIMSSHFSELLLTVFDANLIYLDSQCFAEVPLSDALRLLKVANGGGKAIENYLKTAYPVKQQHYYTLADPCGWMQKEKAEWRNNHNSRGSRSD